MTDAEARISLELHIEDCKYCQDCRRNRWSLASRHSILSGTRTMVVTYCSYLTAAQIVEYIQFEGHLY